MDEESLLLSTENQTKEASEVSVTIDGKEKSEMEAEKSLVEDKSIPQTVVADTHSTGSKLSASFEENKGTEGHNVIESKIQQDTP